MTGLPRYVHPSEYGTGAQPGAHPSAAHLPHLSQLGFARSGRLWLGWACRAPRPGVTVLAQVFPPEAWEYR